MKKIPVIPVCDLQEGVVVLKLGRYVRYTRFVVYIWWEDFGWAEVE